MEAGRGREQMFTSDLNTGFGCLIFDDCFSANCFLAGSRTFSCKQGEGMFISLVQITW